MCVVDDCIDENGSTTIQIITRKLEAKLPIERTRKIIAKKSNNVLTNVG